MNRTTTLLMFFLPAFLIQQLKAQVVVNHAVLTKMSKDIQLKEKDNHDRAVQLAASKGWILKRVTPGGKVITLVGLDPFGNPGI